MKPIKLQLFGVALALAGAVASAGAEDDAYSSYTVKVAGTLTGAPEKISCAGPVNISVMLVRDTDGPTNAVLTIDTTALACRGEKSRAKYLNTGHAVLTRLLSASDQTEAAISVFPDSADGHMKARSALLSLKVDFNEKTGALTKADIKLSNTRGHQK